MTATADLYLRLSLDFEGATSIDRQEADCRRWCAAHGLVVRRVHVDRGVSGFLETARRDGFDAALAAVSAGEAGTLVVWKLDRLSRRGMGQVGQLLDRFEKAGGRLVSVQDQLDTSQPQARMIIALLSEFARAESETMGVRVRSAKEAQRAAGVWLCGKPPFGYAVAADQRLVPVDPAASLMREVFRMIATGHTLVMVCHHLNSRGYRNGRGNPWMTGTLSSAIRTPAYAGLQPARHVTSTGKHAPGHPAVYRDQDTGQEVSCLSPGAKPIISRAEQLAVLEILAQRMRRYGRGALPSRPAYALLLRGLGRWANCDRPLVTHGSYKCRRYDRSGTLICALPTSAGIQTVDRRVAAAWQQLVATPSSDTQQLRRSTALRWAPRPKALTGWRRLQAELDDLQVRLADADEARYVRGDLDAPRHARVVGKLDQRISHIEADLAALEQVIDTSPLDNLRYVGQHWDLEAPEGRRQLLRLAWDKILVAKASIRGGHFDPSRISYVPACKGQAHEPRGHRDE